MKGVRPLGGTVEFGETAEAAVIREFHEELGVTVEVIGPPVFMENIYTHEGSLGHELIAIFDVKFSDTAYDTKTRIKFQEDSGTICFAEWFSLDTLDQPDRPRLYPDGLKAHRLTAR